MCFFKNIFGGQTNISRNRGVNVFTVCIMLMLIFILAMNGGPVTAMWSLC